MSSAPFPVAIRPYRAITAIDTAGSSAGSATASGIIRSTTAVQETILIADAVVEERHDDELVITEHPVEVGAIISDHAFKLPAKLGLIYAWSAGSPQNSTQDAAFLKNLYQKFLAIQAGRVFCTVNTGKRIYKNMLMQAIATTSDRDTENILSLRLLMVEIILATTQIVPLGANAQQALPQQTAPVVNQGNVNLQNAPNFNAGAP